jgi:glycerol uptake facilitator-like aquaporin
MLREQLLAEFFGTAFLVMVVIGSGIMGQNLFPGQAGLALLANSIATGAGLFVIIQAVGPISGSHINPVVSLVELLWGKLSKKAAILYVLVQFAGAHTGIWLTHLMFDMPVLQLSATDRSGMHLFISEIVATFGLISVIALSGKKHVEFAPLSIAAYITSAYWFTSSTSFANPAVTYARMFTYTFGGMAPVNFVALATAQLIGAVMAWALLRMRRQ